MSAVGDYPFRKIGRGLMTPEDRLDRLSQTIEAQKAFLHRVVDPDTRERAEAHLLILVDMREDAFVRLQSTQDAGA